ncbi:MAG: hypothetical protein IPK78_10900 [Rhodospirillales bacterium]|nr:hypothetical protein [Rhodospirillales bacterium]
MFAIDEKANTIIFFGGARVTASFARLLYLLAVQHRVDLQNKVQNKRFEYIKTADLVRELGVDEQSLRQQVLRCRKWLSRSLKKILGRAPGRDEVIESKKWTGYRLNPRMVLVDSAQLSEAEAIGRAPLFQHLPESSYPPPARDPSAAASRL